MINIKTFSGYLCDSELVEDVCIPTMDVNLINEDVKPF